MSSLITVRQEISALAPKVTDGNVVSTVLNLDSCRLEFPSFQQCCDITSGALRLRFLFLLECPETLDGQAIQE